MSGRRTYGSYDDGCAAAHALDVIGERWSMSIIRELLLGPKRFSELERDIAGVGPTTLTRRLTSLAGSGVLQKSPAPDDPESLAYELTTWGYQLEQVNAALAAWGSQSTSLPVEASMTPDTIVLAMRAHARVVPTSSRSHEILLHISTPGKPARTYRASLTPGEVALVRGDDPGKATPEEQDAEITCTASDLKNVIIAGIPHDALDGFTVSGDRSAVERLIAATRL